MDKRAVIRSFSRYAHLYDRYAQVQRQSALELLGEIKEDGFHNILEIGCGTGNYTLLLRDKFKRAKFKVVDISERMIEISRRKLKNKGIDFIVVDAEALDLKETFDLITSHACFQWFEDLKDALIRFKNILNYNGLIIFSIFGPLTFWELNSALGSILKGNSIKASSFISEEELQHILENNFRHVQISSRQYQEYFADIQGLLKKIKYSGIRGNGLQNQAYPGRNFFAELEESYLDKFKEIRATYQVFFCRAKI